LPKNNWGPQLLADRNPGVIEAVAFVCAKTYGLRTTV
jgi:hypothetical protein